jgi:hypothetical protein
MKISYRPRHSNSETVEFDIGTLRAEPLKCVSFTAKKKRLHVSIGELLFQPDPDTPAKYSGDMEGDFAGHLWMRLMHEQMKPVEIVVVVKGGLVENVFANKIPQESIRVEVLNLDLNEMCDDDEKQLQYDIDEARAAQLPTTHKQLL